MGNSRPPDGTTPERLNAPPWTGLANAGRWEGPQAWPEIAIHRALLHTGKVLLWQGAEGTGLTDTYLWDPSTGTFSGQNLASNVFCAGHAQVPDGGLLVNGGNTTLFKGPRTTFLFDPDSASGSEGPRMDRGRYYPTSASIGDGRVLIFSGNTELGSRNTDLGAWKKQGPDGRIDLLHTGHHLELYPRMHLLSWGKVFHCGPEPNAETFDPVAKQWTFVASSSYGVRAEGTSVLLPPGHAKVMIVGGRRGGDPEATPTAEVIDLSAPAPAWVPVAPMLFRRIHANAVILPDGKVLIAGGGYDDVVPAYPAELFDPVTESWSLAGTMKSFRLYHSTALLLPDGRAVAAGSNGNPTAEIYSPGYLFRGPRPTIPSVPPAVGYGDTFTVGTSEADSITRVVFVRPGAVTHSVNMEQRYVELPFSAGAGELSVTAPSDADVAPPGYYMLVILGSQGVPSKAEFIKLE